MFQGILSNSKVGDLHAAAAAAVAVKVLPTGLYMKCEFLINCTQTKQLY